MATPLRGKTGTAQKVDPATGAYSKTKYVASFVGFAPVNNPAITIAVILDSAQGLHQGGQVSAPVFKRIAEQVLEYMHVPHDIEPKNQRCGRRCWLPPGRTMTRKRGSDHLGAPMMPESDDAARSPTQANQQVAATPSAAGWRREDR